jgi:hypothetical protein
MFSFLDCLLYVLFTITYITYLSYCLYDIKLYMNCPISSTVVKCETCRTSKRKWLNVPANYILCFQKFSKFVSFVFPKPHRDGLLCSTTITTLSSM